MNYYGWLNVIYWNDVWYGRKTMHCWKVLQELGKLCVFYVLHWLIGQVWVLFPPVNVPRKTGPQTCHRRSLLAQCCQRLYILHGLIVSSGRWFRNWRKPITGECLKCMPNWLNLPDWIGNNVNWSPFFLVVVFALIFLFVELSFLDRFYAFFTCSCSLLFTVDKKGFMLMSYIHFISFLFVHVKLLLIVMQQLLAGERRSYQHCVNFFSFRSIWFLMENILWWKNTNDIWFSFVWCDEKLLS